MSVSGLQGDSIITLNEDNAYYQKGKDMFEQFADSVKDKSREHMMSISGMFKFLRSIGLLDEIIMTALNLDELFNEFNSEFIHFEQFIEMMSKFSAMKMRDMNVLMKFIIQQTHITLDTANEDGTSEGSSTSISSRSDVSNAYTYYPIHDARNTCVDELASTDDEAEEGRESNGGDDQLLATPNRTHSIISVVPSMGQYEEDENENREDAGLSGSHTQFEIPGIPLPTQQERTVANRSQTVNRAVDRASKNMLTPARNT